MPDISITQAIFGGLVICLILGVPIGFSLGVAAALGLMVSGIPFVYLAETFFSGTEIFPLLAIPGFILAGNLMARSGITDKIIDVIYEIAGNVPGGIAIVTILSCMFFAALSGSGPATTAAIGAIMIPAMQNAGYPKRYAASVASTGGTIGIMIPPSNPMIMYGVVANLSVAGLFMAGFLPGAILGAVLACYCLFTGKLRGYRATGKPFSARAIAKSMWVGAPALFMPVLVLGSIYGGFATPTEASMLAVVYALILGTVLYRKLSLSDIVNSIVEAGQLTGAILIIMGPAMAFGKLLTMYTDLRIPAVHRNLHGDPERHRAAHPDLPAHPGPNRGGSGSLRHPVRHPLRGGISHSTPRSQPLCGFSPVELDHRGDKQGGAALHLGDASSHNLIHYFPGDNHGRLLLGDQ
jgi:C4-dicarboxylate transporter DctM subunit